LRDPFANARGWLGVGSGVENGSTRRWSTHAVISLEDERGVVRVICWKSLRDSQGKELLKARLPAVYGTWQREDDEKNMIAGRLEGLTPVLGRPATECRDFR
jgi:DNA polymerase III alpha subunit